MKINIPSKISLDFRLILIISSLLSFSKYDFTSTAITSTTKTRSFNNLINILRPSLSFFNINIWF